MAPSEFVDGSVGGTGAHCSLLADAFLPTLRSMVNAPRTSPLSKVDVAQVGLACRPSSLSRASPESPTSIFMSNVLCNLFQARQSFFPTHTNMCLRIICKQVVQFFVSVLHTAVPDKTKKKKPSKKEQTKAGECWF